MAMPGEEVENGGEKSRRSINNSSVVYAVEDRETQCQWTSSVIPILWCMRERLEVVAVVLGGRPEDSVGSVVLGKKVHFLFIEVPFLCHRFPF